MAKKRKDPHLQLIADGKSLELTAETIDWIKAEEGDQADEPKRFSMTAYTGGPLMVGYFSSPVVIDLTGLKAAAPTIPALMHHDTYQIVGHIDDVQISESSLKVAGAISGTGPAAQEVLGNARNGFPWRASVGARPDKMEFVGEGIQTKVNGKTFTGPLYVARKATLGEVSFVPIGADSKTTVKVAASAAGKECVMNEFDKWVQALGFDPATLTDAQTMALQAKFDAEVKAAAASNTDGDPEPEVPEFDRDEIRAVASEYLDMIEATAADYDGKIEPKQLATIKATATKTGRELKAKALKEKWAATRLEIEAIKARSAFEVDLIRAERPQGPAIHSSRRDLNGQVIEAALCMSAGLRNVEKAFKPEILEAASLMPGFGVQELLLMAAGANGYQGRQRIGVDNLRDVLSHAMPIAASGTSTIAVSGILGNVANKMLLDGFTSVPQTWREIATTRPVADFKTVTAYRLTASLEYEEVGPSGEIKHGELGEESYTMSAKTYAKMLGLTRQDIINDDLGAFDDLRTRLGMGATLKLNKVFWTLWINNSSFFTSDRANVQTSSALADATIAAAVALFRAMTGPDGNLLGLEPAVLLVPPGLEATARRYYVSQEIRDTTSSTRTGTANVWLNKFKPVVVPELANSGYTGYSATTWYLLADPKILATAMVVFLNGQQSPTIESADADFSTLGIQFRGYHDFGAAMTEYRAGVKSTA